MEEIHSAARRGDEGEVTRLLDADPTLIETDDIDGETPLVVAAEHGQLGVTRLLVQRGANINVIVQYYGRTALHYAAEEAHEEVVAFLLEKGAQTSNSEGDNVTPLMLACRNGHVGVVQMIVTHTGPHGLEDRDICGKTALRYAAEEGHGEVVALLLGKGAQASTRDDETVTPLMSACEKGHVGVVRMLITHTGPHGLEDRDTEGKTALRYAAEEGHGEVVAFLLGKGAQASTRDDENVTPLMWACDNGHLGVVRILVQHTGGEGLDTRDDQYGWTTLHGAAFWSYEEVVRFLLVSGADPTITDIEGMTALEVATQEDEYVGGDEDWRARRARCVAVFKVSEPTYGGLCGDLSLVCTRQHDQPIAHLISP
jgi:ankyrin repeat protein